MKKRSLSLTEKKKRKIKHFWKKDGTDFIAKLGKLDRAIVIRYFTPNFPSHSGSYYGIANASFLPFTDKEHKTKFNDPIDCIEFAESIVLDWVKSLFVNEEPLQPTEQSIPPDDRGISKQILQPHPPQRGNIYYNTIFNK